MVPREGLGSYAVVVVVVAIGALAITLDLVFLPRTPATLRESGFLMPL